MMEDCYWCRESNCGVTIVIFCIVLPSLHGYLVGIICIGLPCGLVCGIIDETCVFLCVNYRLSLINFASSKSVSTYIIYSKQTSFARV